MTQHLLADVGNSKVGLADWDESSISNIRWIDTDTLNHTLDFRGYSTVTVSSVVPSVDTQFPPQTTFITPHLLPMPLNVKTPNEVGADRLVNAFAAFSEYGGPTLVIDSGTATTVCFVDATGGYQGGAIFPGLKMASQALNDHTEKIPVIWIDPISTFIGKTTEEAVQAGIYHSSIFALNGYIASYKARYPEIVVVGTGAGLTPLNTALNLDYFDPDLIFKGLSHVAKTQLK